MASLGLLALGGFVGSIIFYGLYQATDWSSPVTLVSGCLSAAVSGVIFIFIKYLDVKKADGSAIYFYPVGLAYGALCINLQWISRPDANFIWSSLHVGVFAIVTVALFFLFFFPQSRRLLPSGDF